MARKMKFLESVDSLFIQDERTICIRRDRDRILNMYFQYGYDEKEKIIDITIFRQGINYPKLIGLLESIASVETKVENYNDCITITDFSDAREVVAAVAMCCKHNYTMTMESSTTAEDVLTGHTQLLAEKLEDKSRPIKNPRSRTAIHRYR